MCEFLLNEWKRKDSKNCSRRILVDVESFIIFYLAEIIYKINQKFCCEIILENLINYYIFIQKLLFRNQYFT